MEHSAPLAALLYLPVGVMALLTLVHVAAQAGCGPALTLEAGYIAASPAMRFATLLMLVSATVHFALIPEHMCAHWSARLPFTCPRESPLLGQMQEPYTAMLFALDGLGFVLVSVAVFVWPAGRAVALGLLAATIVAYLYYLDSGRETADPLGIATKAIELVALALLVIPRATARVLDTRRIQVPQFSQHQESYYEPR